MRDDLHLSSPVLSTIPHAPVRRFKTDLPPVFTEHLLWPRHHAGAGVGAGAGEGEVGSNHTAHKVKPTLQQ